MKNRRLADYGRLFFFLAEDFSFPVSSVVVPCPSTFGEPNPIVEESFFLFPIKNYTPYRLF